MRCFLPALLLVIVAFTQEHALAQVMQNMNYEQELQHAKSLLAGETATDISHHIHYDLKLYDRDNHQSTATYDIYRDPAMNQHVEIKARDYALMQIANLRDKKEWLHYTGDKPPYAQMFNRTIMYDEWLPIGTHTVPGSIRIYEGKKLLVEATGTVETVNKFPEHFMEMPETPSQADPTTAHKAVRYQPIDASGASYGNTEIRVSADEKGQVTKADVIDSDDKRLEGVARKFARNIVFQPQVENGQPVPFTSVIYVEYYPRSADE